MHERSLCTEFYRIDRFVRRDAGDIPSSLLIESRTVTDQIEHDVAKYVIWGGAIARRTELANTERHHHIPVLNFHRIADEGPPALARYLVVTAAFCVQMSWLWRNGYHAILAEELLWFLQHQHPFVGRPVMINFDDGYQDFADTAWPILRRHNFRAEVFVVTDHVSQYADWDSRFAECAYGLGFSTESAVASLVVDSTRLPRLEVRGDMALDEFVSVLEACR